MNIEEQVELLMQGTEYGDEELKKAMSKELRQRLLDTQKEGRPLRVYCGFDPRTSDLHLGHTIPMRKLRQFQDLGHDVTFLVGTGTSMVGDPSDKDKLRAVLTKEETEHNPRTYAEQAYRILDHEKTRVRFNHEWLLDLKLADLIKLGSAFTIQQFVSRAKILNCAGTRESRSICTRPFTRSCRDMMLLLYKRMCRLVAAINCSTS